MTVILTEFNAIQCFLCDILNTVREKISQKITSKLDDASLSAGFFEIVRGIPETQTRESMLMSIFFDG